jgi:hypothetical protein
MEMVYRRSSPQSQNIKVEALQKKIILPNTAVEIIEPASGESALPKSRWGFEAHMCVIFGLIFLTALVFFAALRLGGDYYGAAIAARPQHPVHGILKPSGIVGQGFGVFGALFCFLTLLYPLRKRWGWLENFGPPRTWFQFHVYFGIAGPLLATLHTTFKFSGLAAICYWSMILVMASGFIGRFLFALAPRNQRGVILSLKEIDAEIKLVQRYLETAGLRQTSAASAKVVKGWRLLFRLWLERHRELRAWNQRLRAKGLPVATAQRILPLLSRKLFLESSRITLDLTTRAFSHWHTLHLPFTYLMYITLIIHAALAIFLGYTWIF